MTSWYLMPEYAGVGLEREPQIEQGETVCAMSVPFLGEALVTDYAKIYPDTPTYFGIKSSAILCGSPMKYQEFFD